MYPDDIDQYSITVADLRQRILDSVEFRGMHTRDPKISIVSRLDSASMTDIITKYLSVAVLIISRDSREFLPPLVSPRQVRDTILEIKSWIIKHPTASITLLVVIIVGATRLLRYRILQPMTM